MLLQRHTTPQHEGARRGQPGKSRREGRQRLSSSSRTADVPCCPPSCRTAAHTPDQQQQLQQQLDAEGIAAFARQHAQLAAHLGGDGRPAAVTEILEGVINHVWRVEGASGRAAIVKQALPFVRAVGPSFPLSPARQDVEAAAMALLHDCCPRAIPKLLARDPAAAVLAMEAAPAGHKKLLLCIREGCSDAELPHLATELAQLLAAFLARTSVELLPQSARSEALARFANTDIVAANERVVLISPFDPRDGSNRWSPALADDVQQLWADAEVQAAARALLAAYRSRKEALIHNDLHAGNLLAAPNPGGAPLVLIDWEFATYGPIAFDLGSLLGNLMLAVLSLRGMAEAAAEHQQHEAAAGGGVRALQRRLQAEWLIGVVGQMWAEFLQRYPAALQQQRERAAAGGSSAAGHRACSDVGSAAWQQLLLADSCGYAGCCLVRLTIGVHHYPEFELLPESIRTRTERACLNLGRQLMRLSARQAGGGSALGIHAVQQLTRQACGGWLPDD